MPFDDNDHHTFINSKYYNINELNALNNKGKYFGILHLNIASLSKLKKKVCLKYDEI